MNNKKSILFGVFVIGLNVRHVINMKKKRLLFLCFSLFFFFSCNKADRKAYIDLDGYTTIVASSIQETLLDTFSFKKPNIVILETIDESILGEIKRISFDDNKLFIFDSKVMQVLVFDINGKYINKIFHKGQGPKEYIQISDFAIDTDKKQILLLCDIPNKLMYFTYEGVLLKEEKLGVYYSRLVLDSNYLYFEKMHDIKIKSSQIDIINQKTGEKDGGLPQLDIQNYLFTKGNSLNKSNNILYVRRFDNSIYEITDGKIIKKYNIDFGKHSFPDRLMQVEETATILKECSENEYIYSMANAVNSEHYIMFKTNRGLFLYDKSKDLLNGYRQLQYTKWGMPFYSYMPLENTCKIVCSIDDPSFIKHSIEHDPPIERTSELFLQLYELSSKLVEDNNPVLFIYEFK